jgi:drug/metabolite transporter (DMT)-like permease
VNSNRRGIAAMLAAVAVFAVMDASMKQLTRSYPPFEVACLRGATAIPIVLLSVPWLGRWRDLVPRRWGQHLLRGVVSIATLTLFIYAVHALPLAEAYALFLCAPLLITALSVPLLKERVDWHGWLAIGIGLLGVITMLRPSPTHLVTLGAAAGLGSALCYALGVILIRKLSHTESTLCIAFSYVVAVSVGTGAIAVPDWVPVQAAHWRWIATLGLTGGVAQILIIEAFRRGSVSVIAPFEYTALVWGMILDWVLWSTAPSLRTLVGGAIVTATGLYVILREHVRGRAALTSSVVS